MQDKPYQMLRSYTIPFPRFAVQVRDFYRKVP